MELGPTVPVQGGETKQITDGCLLMDGSDRSLARRLRRLGRRIDTARAREQPANDNQLAAPPGSGLTRAIGLSAELVGAVGVGVSLGLLIDWVFGTSPWGLIILFMLGFVAGIFNLIREANRIARTPEPPP